jgi:ketosteroid isomerase-like protein
MSQESVVRRAYELLNRRDAEGLADLCADDILIDMTERVFNPNTYHGAAGIREFLGDVDEVWQSYHWTVEETLAAGDAVVAMLHCEGQSREGGPGVDWRVAWLWKLDGTTPTSLRFYRERRKALEAAGLTE